MIHFTCKSFHELNLEELYAILALRQEVFVVEQDCVYLDTDYKDQKSWHLMGNDDQGNLLAYVRIIPKGENYEKYVAIGRVATAQLSRGTGLGKQIMEIAIEWIKNHLGSQSIKISAQCYLTRFYESFGFRVSGDEYLEDGIPHISMILQKP